MRLILVYLISGIWSLASAAQRPNFLFIVADDLGYADIGVHGCKDFPTPHIDSIAAAGIRCTSGYSNHAFCSPMRAGFISGRYQHRFGYETNCPYDPQNPNLGLPDKVVTVPQRLQKAGYATAAFGKWHLGAHSTKHPNNRGFDFFYGFLGGGHDYFTADLSVRDHEGYRQPLMRNGTPEGVPEYLTTALSKEAVKWLRANSRAERDSLPEAARRSGAAAPGNDKPFYLYLAYNAPHTPMQAPEAKLQQFASINDKKRRTYAAMVSAMDDGIGLVLAALDDLGLRDNTVVAFVSDNGGPTKSNGSSNDPLRGDKGSVFEGGVRVPFLVSWPSRLAKGGTYDQPVITMDLPVTALHLAGASTDGPLDGVNLLPHLAGKNGNPPHEALFWRMSNNGDRRFAVRAGNLKLLETNRANDGTPALHDLAADISEKTDLLAGRRPDADRLRALWDAWNESNIPPAFHGYGPYHKAKDQFYRDLKNQPADSPR